MRTDGVIILVLGAAACATSPAQQPAVPCPSVVNVAVVASSPKPRPARRVCAKPPPSAPGPAGTSLASPDSSAPPGQSASSAAPFGPSKDDPALFEFREQFASGRCGDYLIDNPLIKSSPAVQIKRQDGTLVAQLLPLLGIDSYFPSVCGDINGDGVMELLVQYSTGGAHCCHSEIVVTLEPKPRVLLAKDMGDGGAAGPVKLVPGKHYQLVMSDMVLAGADMAVPYAGVPSLPLVLDWDGRAYVDRTRKFPDYVRKQRAAVLKEAGCEASSPSDESCDLWRGTYVGATSRLVGDWPQQRAKLPPKAQQAGDKVIRLLDAAKH